MITATSFALASSHGLTEVLPPTPSIVPSVTSGPPPLLVNFDGSSSSAAAGQTIAQFLWSFGDGTSAQGATVQHTFGQGLFLVVLKVIDSKGASASTSVKISVANTPPVAALVASPSSGVAPLSVLLNTDGSFDPDGTISSYAIDFGDGTSGSGPNATHTYTTPGLYTPTLTVTDNGGASAARSTNVYVGESFTPTSARFGLNFALHPRDTFTIATRTLPIAPNLDTTGLQGTIIIGQASYKFILDSKGNYTSPVLKVKLLPMRAIMTVRIAQANLAAALASSSASNTTVKAQRVLIPFAVNLAGNLSFGSVGLPFSYTAQQGLRATGTFLKK